VNDLDKSMQNLNKFCVIDIGSTTTKAILFKHDSDWQYYRQEAPTTVEKPYEDVTYGVIQALRQLEKSTGERLVENDKPAIPCFSTSSAGGGLAVVVAGLVKSVTSTSAERVALGAGSIILDIIALDDGRTPYRKIDTLKKLRPDMFLLAGGFDGGAIFGPVFLAELLNQSGLKPKLSAKIKLPVIYAGNTDARGVVEETLGERFMYYAVPNIRPSSDKENLEPAREAIHDIFMDHVMSQAPGYEKYTDWISSNILPTPAAFSKIMSIISKDLQAKILAIDIGGATTDVFTADNGKVFRTVSANLGMSYSIMNVVKTAGLDSISELLDFDISDEELLNRIGNKFLKPTELANTIEDTKIECAVASAAIREAVKDHFKVMYGVTLSLGKEELTWNKLKRQTKKKKTSKESDYLADYDIIIGSGGRLSHSPRNTAAMILINALQPKGCVELAVDSIFMFPQLGALSQVNPELACELFYKFGFVRLGKLIAPAGKANPGTEVLAVEGSACLQSGMADKQKLFKESFRFGEFKIVPIETEKEIEIGIKTKKLKLKKKSISVNSSDSKLIIDTRGRPALSKCGYFIPDDFKPYTREIKLSSQEQIYQGEIRIKRELVIPGEVFVSEGENVASEKVIAKCTRAFLRPFFLNIADDLHITGDELSKIFHKKVGDEVKAGEILARNEKSIFHQKSYRSTVTGIIEKILPNGAVVVREKEEHSGQLCSVKAANELNVEPKFIKPYLKCEVGQEVEKGQWLAAIPGAIPKACKSPIRGKVKDINLEYGIVIIESLLEQLELNAWLPGKVDNATDKGCEIVNHGSIITGIWGSGGEVFGRLAFDDIQADDIAVMDHVKSGDLASLMDKNITGLIAGGLNLKDYYDQKPEFTIVMIEGFGKSKLSQRVRDLLIAHKGKLAVIDGTTQLRVGVKRPQVILPERLSPE